MLEKEEAERLSCFSKFLAVLMIMYIMLSYLQQGHWADLDNQVEALVASLG